MTATPCRCMYRSHSEAQLEARLLMLSTNNLLLPQSGKPVATPSQDMVLGCHYLTRVRPGAKGEGMRFHSIDEVQMAVDCKYVDIHALIKVRINGELVETTGGRVIFSNILPKGIPFL